MQSAVTDESTTDAGVINLRGRPSPVVDPRRRFGLPSAERTRASRIMVIEIGDQVGGTVVDSVSEVLWGNNPRSSRRPARAWWASNLDAPSVSPSPLGRGRG